MTPAGGKNPFPPHILRKKAPPGDKPCGAFLRSLRVPAAAEKPAGEKILPQRNPAADGANMYGAGAPLRPANARTVEHGGAFSAEEYPQFRFSRPAEKPAGEKISPAGAGDI